MIRIATILGSARENNPTAQALAVVHDQLKTHPDVEITIIEPADMQLFIPGLETGPSDRDKLQEMVSTADGVILATPEYHGSYSSLIKLTIENLGYPSALYGKPVTLLGVAGGRLGAIKSLEHLRSVCAHIGALVLPSVISLAHAGRAFTPDGACTDPQVEKSLRSLPDKLIRYIQDTTCPDLYMEKIAREGID